MDTFRTFARRLIVALALCAAAVLLPADVVHAADYTTVMAECQQNAAWLQTPDGGSYTVQMPCTVKDYGTFRTIRAEFTKPGWTEPKVWEENFDGAIPDACSGLQPRYGTVEVTGNGTTLGCDGQCSYALTEGDQTSNGLGQSLMVGTWTPTGGHCSTPTPGLEDGAPEPPSLCGKASCVKPSGDVCAKDKAGNSMCVDAPTATGAGGCTGTADGAICAGPKPPLPTPPTLSQITDPATEITGSDHYTQQTTTPGGTLPIVTPINVNTYGVGGAADSPTSSGQQTGDKGPAPSSSTGSNPGSYGGGADCNSPPACSGDPVMCGVARQNWYAMCQQHKDADKLYKAVAGDGTAPDPADPPSTSGFASDLWNTPGAGTGDPIGDAANQGNYDQSGLGFSTVCPLHDMTVALPDGHSFDIKFSTGCELGGWLKAIIIAFALFAAAKITAGGTG